MPLIEVLAELYFKDSKERPEEYLILSTERKLYEPANLPAWFNPYNPKARFREYRTEKPLEYILQFSKIVYADGNRWHSHLGVK